MPDVGRCLMPAWWARAVFVTLVAAASAGHVQAQLSPQSCGSLEAPEGGPFDYRHDRYKPPPGDKETHETKLQRIERFHFTPAVEALIRGNTSTTPGHDLDFTLRYFPNHHRVLAALIRLRERSKLPQPADLSRPLECYFERAVRFQPDDTTARMLYAMFLHKDNRQPEALHQLEKAHFYAEDNAFTHYNIGLVYLDVGEPAKALAQAHRARVLGFPRMELKNRLIALGKWQEPIADLLPLRDSAAPLEAAK